MNHMSVAQRLFTKSTPEACCVSLLVAQGTQHSDLGFCLGLNFCAMQSQHMHSFVTHSEFRFGRYL